MSNPNTQRSHEAAVAARAAADPKPGRQPTAQQRSHEAAVAARAAAVEAHEAELGSDERADLEAEAERIGLVVDGRWSNATLRSEITDHVIRTGTAGDDVDHSTD